MTSERYSRPASTERRIIPLSGAGHLTYALITHNRLHPLGCYVTGLLSSDVMHDWVYDLKQHFAYYGEGFWCGWWQDRGGRYIRG